MADKPSKEELRALWENDAHWSGGIYFCKKDPRFFVPKRHRWMGWTINFGHRAGSIALLILILGMYGLGMYVGSQLPG